MSARRLLTPVCPDLPEEPIFADNGPRSRDYGCAEADRAGRRVAGARARGVAFDLRDAPSLDADRRQDATRPRAVRESLVELHALCDRARTDHVADAVPIRSRGRGIRLLE